MTSTSYYYFVTPWTVSKREKNIRNPQANRIESTQLEMEMTLPAPFLCSAPRVASDLCSLRVTVLAYQ
jgi:hypothetical protein